MMNSRKNFEATYGVRPEQLDSRVKKMIGEMLDRREGIKTRPHEVRCAVCKGRGVGCKGRGGKFQVHLSGVSYKDPNHCMQCAGTGVTPICGSELMKAGRTA